MVHVGSSAKVSSVQSRRSELSTPYLPSDRAVLLQRVLQPQRADPARRGVQVPPLDDEAQLVVQRLLHPPLWQLLPQVVLIQWAGGQETEERVASGRRHARP